MKPFCYLSYRPKYSGYGYGAQQFASAFKRRGVSFTFRHDAHLIKHSVKEDIVIHSGFPHFFRLDERRINIARVMLESDSLPRLWVDVLNSMDEVWAASRFNVRTFKNAGVDPSKIHVIPDIADPRFAHAAKLRKRRKGRAKGKKFRFLSVFLDLSLRKGYDLMLSEFIKNFSGRKDVEWAVQCSANAAKGFRILLAGIKKTGVDVSNIKIIGKRPSARELAHLYLWADCYVLPTRGEGFGRPYLEAASTGLPVIATGFGGQCDFLNSKNSRLLDYRLVNVPAPDALDCYFLAGQRWAQPSRADLSRALNEALERPKREPVDVPKFMEERVMDIISKRLGKVKKVSKTPKTFPPQIVVYDKNWKETQPSPEEFLKSLKRAGRSIGIAGTGRNAMQLARFIERNGFRIPFFIDREEGSFLNKKKYAVDRLPKNGIKADMVVISCYPGAFAEIREKLERRFMVLPVIFYEAG